VLMADSLCPKCHKPALAEHAGSITSYFFQGNYCQCNSKKSKKDSNAAEISIKTNVEVCSNCGKAKPQNSRAGSFSAFLFKELRCSCGASTPDQRSRERVSQNARRNTTERKSFSNKLRLTAFKNNFATSAELLPPGIIIGGVFQIISTIGRGGMGAVYLVNHLGLQRKFALKMLLPDLVNEQTWQRFKAEARTVAALHHPCIVKVYDLGVHENSLPFYSMDYVQGETLEALVQAGGLPLPRVLNLFIQILDGLAYAHRNGVVHRDLKPANIIVEDDDSLKILDFGIAKLLDSPVANQNLTVSGEIFGSPYYMSPEQASGNSVDARTDIYSIGCALFETLTTFVPFDGLNSVEILTKHQNDIAPYMKEIDPSLQLPDSIEYVVAKCLAKLPDDRYQSTKELSLDLSRIREGKNLAKFPHQAKQHRNFTGIGDHNLDNETITEEARSNLPLWYWASGGSCLVIVLIASWLVINAKTSRTDFVPKVAILEPPDATLIEAGSYIEDTHQKISDFLKRRKEPYLSTVATSGSKHNYLTFASDFSIGTVRFKKDGRFASVEAKGRIDLLDCSSFELIANQRVAEHPDLLNFFGPTDLYTLQIENHRFANPTLDSNLRRLTGLTALFLTGEGFNNSTVVSSGNFPQLLMLSIAGLNVNQAALKGGSLIPRLTIFSISQTSPSSISALCEILKQSKRLQVLQIRSCALTGADIQAISHIQSLNSLSLSQIKTTNSLLLPLVSLKNLTYLKLDEIDGQPKEILTVLKKFKTIKSLVVSEKLLSPSQIRELRHDLPRLEVTQLRSAQPPSLTLTE